MKRQQGLPEAAAEITHTAAVRAEELYDAAVKKIGPLLEQAGEVVTPLAQDAKKKGATFASTQMDKAQPAVEDALTRLVHELLPKVQDALRNAAELPVVGAAAATAAQSLPTSKKDRKRLEKKLKQEAKEAHRRSGLALAAFGGLEPQKKSSRGKSVGIVALLAALIGGAVMVLRRYLNQTDESGWAAHEPSMAYSDADKAKDQTADAAADLKDKAGDLADKAQDAFAEAKDQATDLVEDAKDKADDLADKAQDAYGEAKDKAADIADEAQDKAGDLADKAQDAYGEAKDKAADIADEAQDKASDAADTAAEKLDEVKDYGPGSFVGEHAPEGFLIKGNERSMKYHVQGNEGYERTIPDVWFESEEAAEAAGFTKAQR